MAGQLTRTELETLAVMLDSATKKMVSAYNHRGEHAWPYPMANEAVDEIFKGFYEIQQADIIARGDLNRELVYI